ncbi:hypothetical protein MUA04_07270 [Enterobacteriaceae bacterium H11S18]|uniref:hypothetical protein n=1 Tax=Dryocola clanedunensis TaxID=2925396 RepID=UPI0022F0DAD1|nr:hypothetical protein [Dryocola clanedunensis]MCT4705410.1 hypothetical protein [Dryocola clanedunensis]MCT4709984.1 hypothetical protein [Dryocola clanedunensis]
MNRKRHAVLLLPLLLATACTHKPPASVTKDLDPEQNFFMANNQSEPAEDNATTLQGLTDGLAYTSTNNRCIDNLNMLREEGAERYPQYLEEYQKLSEAFTFLNTNKNIMDQAAKRIYTMELKMKVETLCSKIQYSNFVLVHEKRKMLSGI